MCGLVGILPINNEHKPDPSTLKRMVEAIAHRGPDGEGFLVEPGIGLGHARLSIIDIEGGKQPIHNEDQTVWVVFNGEIFNYIELREDLAKRGHKFYTSTDTEVLVHLYEEYGLEFVHHLNGQFAIALWDRKIRRLLLVRDRVGIIPLFYYQDHRHLVFGSEVKALLASGLVDAKLDPGALDQIFTFWCPVAPVTVFSGVRQVRPGEIVAVQGENISRTSYWEWQYPKDGNFSNRTEDQLAEELLDLLGDATRIRLRADVPVGAYLSGGLDSSALVSLITKQNVSTLRSFSIGFENKELDERVFQQALATELGTDNHSVICSDEDVANQFEKVIWHAETPVLRSAPAPMAILSRLVRQQNFKVVLTGEGADEVLGGYDIFKEAKVRQFWMKNPSSEWRHMLLGRLYPYMQISAQKNASYLKAFFAINEEDQQDAMFSHRPRWNMTSQIKLFYSDELNGRLAVDASGEFERDLPPTWQDWHDFNKAEYLEAKTILPGYILSSQGDRMLMANSVEGRFPYLDHRVIEFASKLPPRFKMKVLREKYLLKKAMKNSLPKSILSRYKQPYRAQDASVFLRKENFALIEQDINDAAIRRAGYFDPDKVARLLVKIGRLPRISERDSMAFMGILSTQIWHRLFVNNLHN